MRVDVWGYSFILTFGANGVIAKDINRKHFQIRLYFGGRKALKFHHGIAGSRCTLQCKTVSRPLGLSALHSDDLQMLDEGMNVYDAFYAWIKTASAEVHNADLFRQP